MSSNVDQCPPVAATSGRSLAFTPHPWLSNGHLQTIAGALWRRRVHPRVLEAQEHQIEVDAESRLLARCSWQDDRAGAPTLLIVHGLEGSDSSGYVLGTATRSWLLGWNVIRLNLRNCGGTEHLSPTLYHSGMSHDVRAAVEHLVSRLGVERLYVAAFSLGANLTLRFAGEDAGALPRQLRAIAAISPALDLSAAARALERPTNLLYQKRFVRSLDARLRRKHGLFPGRYDISLLAGMRTVRDYDNRYIAPLFGFRDAEDYYEQASALPYLAAIRLPVLIVHAMDDPFIPYTERVRAAVSANGSLTPVITERGGHVGFVSNDRADRHWAEATALEFLKRW